MKLEVTRGIECEERGHGDESGECGFRGEWNGGVECGSNRVKLRLNVELDVIVVMLNVEELKYVIEDSTIAELLGVQNFSTDEAAILELVKNAYDANALNLKITFQNDTLRFEDNGIGMNADDIKKHWMHIGKSSKEYEIIDENNKKRIQAGSKGINSHF